MLASVIRNVPVMQTFLCCSWTLQIGLCTWTRPVFSAKRFCKATDIGCREVKWGTWICNEHKAWRFGSGEMTYSTICIIICKLCSSEERLLRDPKSNDWKPKMNRSRYKQYKASVLLSATIPEYSSRECDHCNPTYEQNNYITELAALWKKGLEVLSVL